MVNTIAIDFGTSRTKVAYLDPHAQKPQLMRFGHRNEPFMPTLFYLFRDSEKILLGHDAEEMLQEDPAGIVEVLKRKLQERYVYANRRKESPQQLLTFLFSALREQIAREVTAFQGAPPKDAFLTIPVLCGPATENVLKESALSAGFEKIQLLQEPVAAAHAWLSETGETGKAVIVLDCGGGTVDWAYLQRDRNEYHIIPECPPGGDVHIGGHDVDRELLNYLKSISEDECDEIEQKHAVYLQEMRFLKERFCRGLPLRSLKIGNRPINLDEHEVQSIFEERFIQQIIENLRRYLTRVKEISKEDSPVILLAGGSARIRGLKEAVESQCGCKAIWWENSEYATVLGAVPTVQTLPKPTVSIVKTQSCESVERQEIQKNSSSKTDSEHTDKNNLQKVIQSEKQWARFEYVKFWRGHDHKGFSLSSEPHAVRSLAFSPDSMLLASGSVDKSIKIWEILQVEKHKDPKEFLTLKGHKKAVNSCAFSPDGRLLASGSADVTVKLWDVKSGKEIRTLSLRGHNSSVMSCAFSPDGRFLVSGSKDGRINLWDVTKDRILRTSPTSGCGVGVESITFSPNGQLLAYGSGFGEIFLLKVSDWLVPTFWERGILIDPIISVRALRYFTTPISPISVNHDRGGRVYSVCFSPSSNQLVSSGHTFEGIKLWDINTMKLLRTFKHKADQLFGEKIYNVVFSPNGLYIAACSMNSVTIWNWADGEQLKQIKCQGHRIRSIAFSPNGHWLAVGTEDGYLFLYKQKNLV